MLEVNEKHKKSRENPRCHLGALGHSPGSTATTSQALALSLMAALSAAGDCTGTICYVCGKVENDSPWTAKITENPSDASTRPQPPARPDLRNIFNWSGDPWSAPRGCPGGVCICKQKDLAAGKSRGGNTCSGTHPDVDAFCYATLDYVIERRDPASLKVVTKGVWTRIHDYQKAVCRSGTYNGKTLPRCEIIDDI